MKMGISYVKDEGRGKYFGYGLLIIVTLMLCWLSFGIAQLVTPPEWASTHKAFLGTFFVFLFIIVPVTAIVQALIRHGANTFWYMEASIKDSYLERIYRAESVRARTMLKIWLDFLARLRNDEAVPVEFLQEWRGRLQERWEDFLFTKSLMSRFEFRYSDFFRESYADMSSGNKRLGKKLLALAADTCERLEDLEDLKKRIAGVSLGENIRGIKEIISQWDKKFLKANQAYRAFLERPFDEQ
jgi:hypothetical protein